MLLQQDGSIRLASILVPAVPGSMLPNARSIDFMSAMSSETGELKLEADAPQGF